VPAATDGVSLLPALTGRGEQQSGIIYVEYFNNGRTPGYPEFAPAHQRRRRGQMQVIHLDGYKGIRYDVQSEIDDFEIYDLSKDPQETNDLAAQPGFEELQSRMKARVLQVRRPDPDAKRPYDDALVPPIKQEPAGAPGLRRYVYEGDWPWVPDFGRLVPKVRDAVDTVQLPESMDVKEFGVAFSGYFLAEQDGLFTFTLECDTGATLFLHDIRVVNEPVRNSAGTFQGDVRLRAGWHPLRLYSRHAKGDAYLHLQCRLPDGQSTQLNVGNLRQASSLN
jgi:hypothetical protein